MADTQPTDFAHLHLHTHYSLLDGLGRPDDYFRRAKELGMTAIAATDHGVSYGLLEWYQTGKKAGIKPILGVEAYVARFGRHQKRANIDVKPYHLILLAENETGYANLLKLTTLAHTEGYYYKPRMDYEILAAHSEGLIALSACLHGEIPTRLLSDDETGAIEAIERYQKIFGEKNFFLEVQSHLGIPEQAQANERLFALSKKMGVPVAATNDCHYVQKSDAEAHDVLICIQTGKDFNDPNRMRMEGADLYLKSGNEMRAAFSDHPEVCDLTLQVAARCNVELPLGKRLIPTYATPFQLKPEDYFVELCYDGLHRRFGVPVPKKYKRVDGSEGPGSRVQGPGENATPYTLTPTSSRVGSHITRQSTAEPTPEETATLLARLEYELSVIIKMGFANYFLIVWDFVKYSKESGIAVGPGRGSAAGSLISYCLGITDLNPLKYGLLFERFLNPERVSMPDIDIDFADDRRDAVLEYVSDKYGRDHVARICTFGTMAAKAAVKDVGRTFGMSFAEMNAFSALIPSKPGTTLAEALEAEPQLVALIKKEPYKKIWEIATKLEGNIRQVGVHACAVVIADKNLNEYTALQYAPGEDTTLITQYSMHPIEDIGLLKMDFLGLRNLTIIQACLKIIERTKGVTVDIAAIPMDDDKTLELFRKGETTGVFQFESSGMRRYLKDLKPSRFEDLIAMVALYRPGPMENIPDYIKNKEHLDKIKYPHAVLEEHLKETYGVAVYQEQIQQIAQSFAGFSLGQGYLMIKAVAKKIPAMLEEQRELFISGAIKNGHKKQDAEKLFAIIEPFAGYGFNKSHAACYAYIAYQTGYLKAHYPTEFMAGLMAADHGNPDRLTIDIEECQKMGITVLPPSVNESLKQFTVVGEREIRFGLTAIKGLGEGPVNAIITARIEGEKFRDLADFASRVEPSATNKRTIEALAQSGAFDAIEERAVILASTAEISEFAKSSRVSATSTQTSLFGDAVAAPKIVLKLADVPPATRTEKLRWEKELLGMYVSSHPLAGLKKYLSKKVEFVGKMNPKETGKQKSMGGIITIVRRVVTKSSGQSMAFATLEDPTGTFEISLFPKTCKEYGHLLVEGDFVMATGRLEKRGEGYSLSAHEVKRVDLEAMRARAEKEGFLDVVDGDGASDGEVANELIEEIPPQTPVTPYEIRIAAEADPEILKNLKALLTSAKAVTGTEVIIIIESGGKPVKQVRVPFLVGLTPELEAEITGLVN